MNWTKTLFFVAVALFATAHRLPAPIQEIPKNAGGFTREEQALIDKGETMEMYKPDEHSRHLIVTLDSVTDPKTGEKKKIDPPRRAVCFVFGTEDAEPARKEGRSMAEMHYTRPQAEQFLFAQGWDKYHDRFFTRCYVQEGENAYEQAVKTTQRPPQPNL